MTIDSTNKESPYLTMKEMCTYLKCSRSSIYRRLKTGQVRRELVNGKWMFPKKENRFKGWYQP